MTTLYAFELGANLGHVLPLLAHMRAGDIAALPAGQDEARDALQAAGVRVVQAPKLRARPQPRAPTSYAGLMLECGYHDTARLGVHVAAWCAVIGAADPRRIVADHAPGAVLAAAELGRAVVCTGTGFTVPPPSLPDWHTGEASPDAAMLDRHCERAGVPRLSEALSAVAVRRLLTDPRLDPYDPRVDPVEYLPPPQLSADPVRWPDGAGPRLVAYLRDAALSGPLARALSRRRCRVLIRAAAGLCAREAKRWYRQGLSVTTDTVNLPRAVSEADAVIGYGSHGLLWECLRFGRPALMFPGTGEQLLHCARAEAAGLPLILPPPGVLLDADRLVDALLQRIS